NQLQAKNKLLNTDELIKSLTQLRLEKLYYSSYRDFPDNLVKLVDTPDVAMKICAAYQQNPPDALQRFNFMVILSMRAKNGVLTPTELTIVPDCLRAALNDPDAWVRIEALDTFKRFAEEQDRPKLLEMKNDPIEDVRNYSQNALLRLNSTKETH
ncbi:MAG TPA: HEAT repeat domain-containing protein, partial [Cellvibrionaceae bacterium]|nr:HEAT repeat domain-containing protein [Cellvibrionaceae bacterium]